MQFNIPDKETVKEIHAIVIEEYGGLEGIPHPELIEQAIFRPQNYMSYDSRCDVHLVCALILDSLTRYHAFADGNKRTALIAMLFTYNSNGIRLAYSLHTNQKFERLVLDVARKEIEVKKLRSRLRKLINEFAEVG